MAADLHIHILEGIDQRDLVEFFSNTLGSKHFNPVIMSNKKYESGGIFDKVAKTPGIWIGEVSWLKAGLFGDNETYVPGPVEQVAALVGEDLPVIDDEFIVKVGRALIVENSTGYETAKPEGVLLFLREHKGKKCFKVSW